MMEWVFKLLLGAAVGAAVGFVLAKAQACSAETCNVKARMVFSLLAGAVFGAAVAWYFLKPA